MAARHIAGLGHRRVAILATEMDEHYIGPARRQETDKSMYSTTRDRVAGYLAGLGEFGIDGAGVPIYETQSEISTIIDGLDYLFGQAALADGDSGDVRPDCADRD